MFAVKLWLAANNELAQEENVQLFDTFKLLMRPFLPPLVASCVPLTIVRVGFRSLPRVAIKINLTFVIHRGWFAGSHDPRLPAETERTHKLNSRKKDENRERKILFLSRVEKC